MNTKKTVENVSTGKNHTAVNIGSLDSILENYSLIHPKNKQEIKGKVFVKEATAATGTEISFTALPPRSELSYFHIHREVEETYIILKGAGWFQVDDDCFPVCEGSVIRISPEGKRGFCNTSDVPVIYLCIESKENSLGKYYVEDGERITCENLLKSKLSVN